MFINILKKRGKANKDIDSELHSQFGVEYSELSPELEEYYKNDTLNGPCKKYYETGKLKEEYSMRAWPYRILYSINMKRKLISIEIIQHRQGVYK